ncbi:TIGR02679 family protein [Gelria sp. Kuro-4]|uniref:TIGR02679 family protein n=1 Tax=Gelria sp. Kuro-4 TaxID=2796927 RepID=UPI001BEF343A|nr:TIGR02679 family protein [Gelria sp. Kuro-4]BCV24256.1 hypothetical protein kuro4_10290 [Gelria sp. Kuro-4]
MTDLEAYLNQSGLKRLWPAVKRKYEALGRVGGSVKLTALTPPEREAIGGLLALDLSGQAKCKVALARVDAALRASRFGCTLVEALEVIYGADLKTRRDRRRAAAQAWEGFFAALEKTPRRKETARWLAELKAGRGAGYRTLLALYRRSREQALATLDTCLRALDRLPVWEISRTRLPVFAAELTGNPHALDLNTSLGRLVLSGITCVLGLGETPLTAAEQREAWRRAGLGDDDISSSVAVAGLKVRPHDPRAAIFAASQATATPLLLPLRFFQQETAWAAAPVYVVENPTVFSAILDAADAGWELPPLINVSGQPSVAALTLLDELAAAGAPIYYSGDFDWEGLQIGLRVAERCGSAFRPWFFDTRAYQAAPAGLPLTPTQAGRLAALSVPWDPQLPAAIRARGVVVYQEAMVPNLLADLRGRPPVPVQRRRD